MYLRYYLFLHWLTDFVNIEEFLAYPIVAVNSEAVRKNKFVSIFEINAVSISETLTLDPLIEIAKRLFV